MNHALIITLNEQIHLGRCIESLRDQCETVTVIDSFSTDETRRIAESRGATFILNPFVNHAAQVNFGIEHLVGRGGWILRIDADEIIDPEGFETLLAAVTNAGSDVDGLLVQRRIHFLGRRIRHGAIEPSWQLRLWRNGRGRCEQRWMDEHIQVAGRVARSGIVISDINLNSITWWTAKHNSYASREAIEILNLRHRLFNVLEVEKAGMSGQARRRRFIKERLYAKLPSGLRSVFYFVYRYILRLGFLDGYAGFYFHLMQALWYRTLVDAKVYEIEQIMRFQERSLPEVIKDRLGVDVGKSPEQ